MSQPIHPSQYVAHAERIARAAHTGQRYGDAPYIEHVRTVASVCQLAGERAATVGYLHDVIEDSDMTLQGLRTAGFDDAIVASVDLLTRPAGMTYSDYITRFGEFPYADDMRVRPYDTAYAPAHGVPMALIVKLADNLHHTSPYRLGMIVPEEKRSLYKRYLRSRERLTALSNPQLVAAMMAHTDRLVAARC